MTVRTLSSAFSRPVGGHGLHTSYSSEPFIHLHDFSQSSGQSCEKGSAEAATL